MISCVGDVLPDLLPVPSPSCGRVLTAKGSADSLAFLHVTVWSLVRGVLWSVSTDSDTGTLSVCHTQHNTSANMSVTHSPIAVHFVVTPANSRYVFQNHTKRPSRTAQR